MPEPRRHDDRAGSHEQRGHKEASWVQPSTTGEVHVGSIFFRTKDPSVDANDRRLLGSLANAYARYAERDKGRHTGAPVTANVVGYADPRPSHEPDNDHLAEVRASSVATALDSALAASGLANTLGYARTDHHGAGVDAAAGAAGGDAVEANALAPFRRADIFVHGKGELVDASPAPVVDVTDRRPRPPDYSERTHGFDKFKPYLDRGHKPSILAMAMFVLNVNADNDMIESMLAWSIEPIEPPWWGNRDPEPAPAMGRGGPISRTSEEELIEKARRVAADFRVYSLYAIDHDPIARARYADSGGQDLEARRVLAELYFMVQAVRAEADELRQLAGG